MTFMYGIMMSGLLLWCGLEVVCDEVCVYFYLCVVCISVPSHIRIDRFWFHTVPIVLLPVTTRLAVRLPLCFPSPCLWTAPSCLLPIGSSASHLRR